MIVLSFNISKDRVAEFLKRGGFTSEEKEVWHLESGINRLRVVLHSSGPGTARTSLKCVIAGKIQLVIAVGGAVFSYFFLRDLSNCAPELWRLVESRSGFFEWLNGFWVSGALLAGYFFIALGLAITARLAEREWMLDLTGEFGGTIIRPPSKGSVFERATWPIYLMSYPLLFWFADYFGSRFLLAIGVLLIVGDGVPNVLRFLTREDGASQWRWLFLDSLSAWTTAVLLTLLMVYALGTGSSFLSAFAGSQLTSAEIEKRIVSWQMINRDQMFPQWSNPQTQDAKALSAALRGWALDHYSGVIREANPLLTDSQVRDLAGNFASRAALQWALMITLLLFLLTLGVLFQLRQVLLLPANWRKNLSELVPLFSAPGVEFRSRTGWSLTCLGLLVWFAYAGLLNWIGAVVAIDIWSFFLVGRTVVFSGLQTVFSLADIPFLLVDKPDAVVLCRVPLLVFGLFPLGFAIVRFQSRCEERDKPLESQLKEVFMDLCGRFRCRGCLRVSKTGRLESYAWVPLVPFVAPRIVISTGSVQAYSEAELRAVIGHELAHVRKDSFRIKTLRLLSLMLLLPNDAATMLVDFVKAEFRADHDVVATVGDAASLRSALIKASVYGGLVEKGQDQQYASVLHYFTGKAILCEGHPIYLERLARLSERSRGGSS